MIIKHINGTRSSAETTIDLSDIVVSAARAPLRHSIFSKFVVKLFRWLILSTAASMFPDWLMPAWSPNCPACMAQSGAV